MSLKLIITNTATLKPNIPNASELNSLARKVGDFEGVFPIHVTDVDTGTRQITIADGPTNLILLQVQPGDKVVIEGGDAEGEYTVDTVDGPKKLTVVEAIADATSGKMNIFISVPTEITLPATLESKVIPAGGSTTLTIEKENLLKEWLNAEPNAVSDLQALVDKGYVQVEAVPSGRVAGNDIMAQVAAIESNKGEMVGTAEMAAETSVAVVFDEPLQTDEYTVSVTATASIAGDVWVTDKLATGFTINIGASHTGTFDWAVALT